MATQALRYWRFGPESYPDKNWEIHIFYNAASWNVHDMKIQIQVQWNLCSRASTLFGDDAHMNALLY